MSINNAQWDAERARTLASTDPGEAVRRLAEAVLELIREVKRLRPVG